MSRANSGANRNANAPSRFSANLQLRILETVAKAKLNRTSDVIKRARRRLVFCPLAIADKKPAAGGVVQPMLQCSSLCHPGHIIRRIEQSSNGTIPTLLPFNIFYCGFRRVQEFGMNDALSGSAAWRGNCESSAIARRTTMEGSVPRRHSIGFS